MAMIKLKIDDIELFDSSTNTFSYITGGVYAFEHSLKAISQWEAAYKTPFLSTTMEHTVDSMLDYCTMMCIDGELTKESITSETYTHLLAYIKDSQTATTFNHQSKANPHTIITSEVIYAMMIEARVPIECENWNINRLLVLLNVLDARRNPKKMSVNDVYRQNNELNKLRRQQMNSKG